MISTESLISACEVGQRNPHTYSSSLLWLVLSEPSDKNPLPSLTTFFFHLIEPVFICLPVWNNVFFTGLSVQEILQIFYPVLKTRYKTLFFLCSKERKIIPLYYIAGVCTNKQKKGYLLNYFQKPTFLFPHI